jgi:hypothetical protein
VIAIPLWISLIAWLTFSFGATDGNPCNYIFINTKIIFYSIGWFGLRRDLCEIILGQCPFITLYFNNQFKFGPRPSTTVPTNDIIIDMTTSSINKNFESINMNKLSTANMTNEKNLASQHHFMSLLEPD